MHRLTVEDCYSGSDRDCLPAALFSRWMDHVRGRAHWPGKLQPAEPGKGACSAMCDRRASQTRAVGQGAPVSGAEVRTDAERELAAFYAAVAESYGPEEATLAAENWIEELKKAGTPNAGTFPVWHQITVAAARGLAARVAVQHPTPGKNWE